MASVAPLRGAADYGDRAVACQGRLRTQAEHRPQLADPGG